MSATLGTIGKISTSQSAADKLLPSNNERRSAGHVFVLHILLRIKYFFSSLFYLKPIFASAISSRPSFLRPKGIPEIDYLTMFACRAIWYFGAVVRNYRVLLFILVKLRIMHLANWIYLRLQHRIARIMRESDVDWEKAREIPIPEYDWEKGNPEEFFHTFAKTAHPVILRNFNKGTKLVKDYTFDKIVERWGDEDVLVTTKQEDGVLGKLKDVVNPKVYLHNSEVLFRKYPQFLKDVNTERLEPYLKKKCGFSQLFIGRQGTGSPYHNAATNNMFYMVDGTKRWYFLDPYDFYLSSPIVVWGGAAGITSCLYPDDYNEELSPAFKYCPYYTAELNPGDVLYNPAWWYHGIRNTSDKTVGIATRWLQDGKVGDNLMSTEEDYDINRFASFAFFTGAPSWKYLQDVLVEASPSFDEHSTLREKRNRFASRQRDIAAGKINIDGWRPLF